MSSAPQRPRRRLSAEARRALILDHTVDIVAREGVAQLSIERIGMDSGISKSLVHAYFPNLTELLRDLYQSEMGRIRRSQSAAAEGATTFGDLVHSGTRLPRPYARARLVD